MFFLKLCNLIKKHILLTVFFIMIVVSIFVVILIKNGVLDLDNSNRENEQTSTSLLDGKYSC
ncbi:MAG: hypothetical protein ACI31M_04885 [Bacilli bacterium]